MVLSRPFVGDVAEADFSRSRGIHLPPEGGNKAFLLDLALDQRFALITGPLRRRVRNRVACARGTPCGLTRRRPVKATGLVLGNAPRGTMDTVMKREPLVKREIEKERLLPPQGGDEFPRASRKSASATSPTNASTDQSAWWSRPRARTLSPRGTRCSSARLPPVARPTRPSKLASSPDKAGCVDLQLKGKVRSSPARPRGMGAADRRAVRARRRHIWHWPGAISRHRARWPVQARALGVRPGRALRCHRPRQLRTASRRQAATLGDGRRYHSQLSPAFPARSAVPAWDTTPAEFDQIIELT